MTRNFSLDRYTSTTRQLSTYRLLCSSVVQRLQCSRRLQQDKQTIMHDLRMGDEPTVHRTGPQYCDQHGMNGKENELWLSARFNLKSLSGAPLLEFVN